MDTQASASLSRVTQRDYLGVTIQALTRLSESELQAHVVEPILRSEGFSHVRDNSGAGEHGKDLIAVKTECGRTKLYAIQIKKLRISGRVTSSASLTNLINQLSQTALEPVVDPSTNNRRPPDRTLFITPYPVKRQALESALRRLRDLEQRDITIIDGPNLVDLILQHNLSDIIVSIADAELHYRISTAIAVNRITEAAAFSLSKDLDLDHMYVDISCHPLMAQIFAFANSTCKKSGTEFIKVQSEIYGSLSEALRTWERHANVCVLTNIGTAQTPGKIESEWLTQVRDQPLNKLSEDIEAFSSTAATLSDQIRICEEEIHIYEDEIRRVEFEKLKMTPYGEKADNLRVRELQSKLRELQSQAGDIRLKIEHCRQQERALKQSKYLSVDFGAFFKSAISPCAEYSSGLAKLADRHMGTKEATRLVVAGHPVSRLLSNRTLTELIKPRFDQYLALLSGDSECTKNLYRLPSSRLSVVRWRVFVSGMPGGGKTTLLRRVFQLVAGKESTPIPVFLPLLLVDWDDERGLLDACRQEMSNCGLRLTEKALNSKLKEGGLWLFLDGLDETGQQMARAFAAIQQVAQDYPRLPIMVSCRSTVDIDGWDEALNIRLEPFDDRQLQEFFQNWFDSEPTSFAGILDWLDANKKMKEAARTPLIAALLASLYRADADLPATEVELYGERFDLLITKWDRVKGIEPVPVKVRRKYLHFLGELAGAMHSRGLRSMPHEEANELAENWVDGKYFRDGRALILDCVRRGLLLRGVMDELSFGHLTYQEFMTARWLHSRSDFKQVWKLLTEVWWDKALKFYAAIAGNIEPLVTYAMEADLAEMGRARSSRFEKLLDLCALADCTPPKVKMDFRKYVETDLAYRMRLPGFW